eukprot:10186430-Alexandrium_andersonii.AAC.1
MGTWCPSARPESTSGSTASRWSWIAGGCVGMSARPGAQISRSSAFSWTGAQAGCGTHPAGRGGCTWRCMRHCAGASSHVGSFDAWSAI